MKEIYKGIWQTLHHHHPVHMTHNSVPRTRSGWKMRGEPMEKLKQMPIWVCCKIVDVNGRKTKIPCAAGFLHKNFVSFLCFSEKTEKFLHQTDFPQNRRRLALDKPQKIGYNNTIMSRLCDSVAFAMRKVRAS